MGRAVHQDDAIAGNNLARNFYDISGTRIPFILPVVVYLEVTRTLRLGRKEKPRQTMSDRRHLFKYQIVLQKPLIELFGMYRFFMFFCGVGL